MKYKISITILILFYISTHGYSQIHLRISNSTLNNHDADSLIKLIRKVENQEKGFSNPYGKGNSNTQVSFGPINDRKREQVENLNKYRHIGIIVISHPEASFGRTGALAFKGYYTYPLIPNSKEIFTNLVSFLASNIRCIKLSVIPETYESIYTDIVVNWWNDKLYYPKDSKGFNDLLQLKEKLKIEKLVVIHERKVDDFAFLSGAKVQSKGLLEYDLPLIYAYHYVSVIDTNTGKTKSKGSYHQASLDISDIPFKEDLFKYSPEEIAYIKNAIHFRIANNILQTFKTLGFEADCF